MKISVWYALLFNIPILIGLIFFLVQYFKMKHKKSFDLLYDWLENSKENFNNIIKKQADEFLLAIVQNNNENFEKILKDSFDSNSSFQRIINENYSNIIISLNEYRSVIDKRQAESIGALTENYFKGLKEIKIDVKESLKAYGEDINKNIERLIATTNTKLKDISEQVEQNLYKGFEKTTSTFSDILKRLVIIDEAQKKITELSTDIVSLQDILSDKKSRGAFGEVQLKTLVRNILPEKSFSLQHVLSNETRADCIIFLPRPTGNIVIDSKFPLENYQYMIDGSDKISINNAKANFSRDIRRHIKDIAKKYIIDGETADGAIMFIPAEAIFAEIHSGFPDIVELAHKMKVWITSPTTMMAILTTIMAVIKDEATKKQIHIIQEHLCKLSKDFDLFSGRMANLSTHIRQAGKDVDEVNISAKKITNRFNKIEHAEFDSLDNNNL